jgi:uncharacterized protein
MKSNSRRRFLAAGLGLPVAGLAATSSPLAPAGALNSVATAPQAETKAGLRYRTLGKTGLKVTEVGFGCMITSDPTVIERAADIGINFFDTARGYQNGNNERMVGAALKSKRKNLVLCTKSGASTKDEAIAHLETSLKEIGTDYIDIWYLHAKSSPAQLNDGLLEAQRIAKQQGKVRFVGVSTHAGHSELIPAMIASKNFDVLLTSYNFAMEPGIAELIAAAHGAGMGVVGMKVMAGGFRRVRSGDSMHEKLNREGAMLAMLKWVLRDKHIGTTIPSITDFDQLDQNLRAMTEGFGNAEEKLLARQLDFIRPLYCRMCGACEGTCAQGLPVSDLIRYVSYAEGYGQFSLGRQGYMELESDMRDVRCATCHGCTVKCPNGVQVAARVSRAQELFA